MSDTAPSESQVPPHVKAIVGMIGTLAAIEAVSTDDSAKLAATAALDSARDLSTEMRPLVNGMRNIHARK